ncbi:MAG: aminoacyl-tRNA hydrolase [Patescibacteria group bacterium]|jgi:PTH1 family peptidyl-tRNA hydrolase
MKNIHLYVGLGNPDKKYQLTRHNIGFRVIDALVDRLHYEKPDHAHGAEIWLHQNLAGDKIILAKPMTYMNNSGEAVLELMRFFKIGEDDLTVIQDDIDLDLGLIRTRVGGGTGGHNGIASIQNLLGHEHFKRIKLGIGRPEHQGEVEKYVLSDFEADETAVAQKMIDSSADYVLKLVNQEVEFSEETIKPN